MNELTLAKLKDKLQTLGSLRPEAWERIVSTCQQTELKTNDSLIRQQGTLAYIADGVLKEYDSQNRKNPAIINFIGTEQSIITRKYNQNHYLKACVPTLVFTWDFDTLQNLYQEFKELKIIYDSLCAAYDEQIHFRQLILEKHQANLRIGLFMATYKNQLNLIKKKDMANYLMLYYDTFIRTYRRLL